MAGYSAKAQPFLDAIAEEMFSSTEFRDWVLRGTPHEANYRGADILIDEQQKVREKNKKTEQPFWANYWCGKDTKCTCRIPDSKSL